MHLLFFFLMIRRPPRSTLDRSSAASDVYKRQGPEREVLEPGDDRLVGCPVHRPGVRVGPRHVVEAVSYTHLRAHETVLDLVCRLLLEKKKQPPIYITRHRLSTPINV